MLITQLIYVQYHSINKQNMKYTVTNMNNVIRYNQFSVRKQSINNQYC